MSPIEPGAQGRLYIVAVPLGNVADMSERARRVLSRVHGVLCEDKRRTGRLMADLGLDVRLVAFHAHNQSSMTDKVVEWLQKGQQWALVSDAGTPLVSDPGSWLINTLWQKALPVEPIPGPSAPVAAYSVAGYPPRPTLFLGFLSPKPGKRRRELDKWRGHDIIAIVFESPHRVARLLADALEIWGNVPVTIAREMTKTHESYYRGRVADFWPAWRDERIKGELTLVFWLQG